MAYVTLPTLKLAIGETADDRDDLLTAAINAASAAIDRKTRGIADAFTLDGSATAREFRTRGRTVVDCDGEALIVDDIGDTTGLVVEVGDGATWATVTADGYDTEPDNAIAGGRPVTRLRRVNGYWSGDRKVRVTAVWGWPAVPDDIAQAALIQATRLYKRKDNPEGVAGSADWGLVRMPNLDPDVKAMLAPYMLPGF